MADGNAFHGALRRRDLRTLGQLQAVPCLDLAVQPVQSRRRRQDHDVDVERPGDIRTLPQLEFQLHGRGPGVRAAHRTHHVGRNDIARLHLAGCRRRFRGSARDARGLTRAAAQENHGGSERRPQVGEHLHRGRDNSASARPRARAQSARVLTAAGAGAHRWRGSAPADHSGSPPSSAARRPRERRAGRPGRSSGAPPRRHGAACVSCATAR